MFALKLDLMYVHHHHTIWPAGKHFFVFWFCFVFSYHQSTHFVTVVFKFCAHIKLPGTRFEALWLITIHIIFIITNTDVCQLQVPVI